MLFKRLSVFMLVCGIFSVTQVAGQADERLWRAIENDDYALVKILLGAGADVNRENDQGNTPLMIAIMQAKGLVKLLVEAGADINREAQYGFTSLYCAVNCQDEYLTRWLVKAGANINKKNKLGHPPLYYALGASNIRFIRLLLELGAKVGNWVNECNFDFIGKRRFIDIARSVIPGRAEAIRNFLNVSANNSSSINRGQGFSEALEGVLEEYIHEPITGKSVQQSMSALSMIDTPIATCVDTRGPAYKRLKRW